VTRTTFTRLIEVMIATTSLVGLLDAVGREQADLAIVFAIVLSLAVVLLVHSAVGRRDVPVRRDLVQWMADRAANEGEGVGAIADRAISAYRAGFVAAPSDEVSDADDR
jgi:hypothetical protein